MADRAPITRLDNRLDQLVNIDLGARGGMRVGAGPCSKPPAPCRANRLPARRPIRRWRLVTMSTASVQRAWIDIRAGGERRPLKRGGDCAGAGAGAQYDL